MGYKIEEPEMTRFDENKMKYGWLILIVIIVIFAILVIGMENFRAPLAVIYLIPSSLTGVFLLFGLTDLTFDQGAFAGMIMLCGLVVNAGIYLEYEYRRTGNYITALSNKVRPIALTVFSTVLGLIPFLSKGTEEVFWFTFAITTIVGLVFSLLALLLVFPLISGTGGTSPRPTVT